MNEGKNPDDKWGWWGPENYGGRFYVARHLAAGQVVYHRSKPCNYGPRGRIVTYRTIEAAQRKADALNDQLVEREALHDVSRPH